MGSEKVENSSIVCFVTWPTTMQFVFHWDEKYLRISKWLELRSHVRTWRTRLFQRRTAVGDIVWCFEQPWRKSSFSESSDDWRWLQSSVDASNSIISQDDLLVQTILLRISSENCFELRLRCSFHSKARWHDLTTVKGLFLLTGQDTVNRSWIEVFCNNAEMIEE